MKGKNAGKFECAGEDLVFKVFTTSSKTGEIVGEKRAFDISLSSVKNAQVSSLEIAAAQMLSPIILGNSCTGQPEQG